MDLFSLAVTEIKGASFPGSSDRINFSVREPLGVVARIVPFNHPMMHLHQKRRALDSRECGNNKTFRYTPLSALRIAELAGKLPSRNF